MWSISAGTVLAAVRSSNLYSLVNLVKQSTMTSMYLYPLRSGSNGPMESTSKRTIGPLDELVNGMVPTVDRLNDDRWHHMQFLMNVLTSSRMCGQECPCRFSIWTDGSSPWWPVIAEFTAAIFA